jgi:hypothetical protein
MLLKLASILTLTLFLFSCEGKKIPFLKKHKINYQPSLLHLPTLLTEEENDASFPIWFNDSIIQEMGITKIIRKAYPRNKETDSTSLSVENRIPREVRTYYFYPNGNLKKLEVESYYDDRPISLTTFTYNILVDSIGYNLPMKKTTYFNQTKKEIEEEFVDPEKRNLDFRLHQFTKKEKDYYSYQDVETGDFVYFLINEKLWKPLSVDILLRPTRNDLIVFGSSYNPIKKYQVYNKVTEKNVKHYTFQKKSKETPNYWVKSDYPFENKRSFTYNNSGYCSGYIDSTFSDHQFVTKTWTEIIENDKRLPKMLIHKKTHKANTNIFYSIETYTYEY